MSILFQVPDLDPVVVHVSFVQRPLMPARAALRFLLGISLTRKPYASRDEPSRLPLPILAAGPFVHVIMCRAGRTCSGALGEAIT